MALKRIAPAQVEMGMFVQAFQGNWLRHPFWRAQFLVEDDERLIALRGSNVEAIVIDTDLGIDVPGDTSRQATASSSKMAIAASPRHLRPLRQPRSVPPPVGRSRPVFTNALRSGPVPVHREFGNARLVAGKARKVISRVFIEARLGNAPRVSEVAPVVEDIHASMERNPFAFSGLMHCKAVREPVYRHMLATSALMISLARQMKLSAEESRLAGMAGLMLDIGASKLEVEFQESAGGIAAIAPAIWDQHSVIGHDLLAAAGDIPEEVLRAVARHHEYLDGSGRPHGLHEFELDVYARMAAVCDHYDLAVCGALTGQPQDPADVLRYLGQHAGRFDAEIVAGLVEALGNYPVGAFVELRSGRIAMVVDQDPEALDLPTVHAFFSTQAGKRISGQTIPLAHCYGEDAIARVADLSAYELPPADELRARILATIQRQS